MNDREQMLKAIAGNKPAFTPLPGDGLYRPYDCQQKGQPAADTAEDSNAADALRADIEQREGLLLAGQAALREKFIQMLTAIGGEVRLSERGAALRSDLKESAAGGQYIVNMVPEIGRVNGEVQPGSSALLLEPVYKAYIRAALGVAENGAVWMTESNMVNRLLPFICQHLVVVLNAGCIVADMHEAYRQIRVGEEGYGTFLAGPSKTADIEQSLVIGAHGARSLVVYLED